MSNFKSEKGITLIALIIYILVLIIVLSALTLITSNAMKNSSYISERGKYMAELNKFNVIFLADCKTNRDTINVTNNEIEFESGVKYTFKDNGIYRDNLKVCNEVSNCHFEKIFDNEKNILKVKIELNKNEELATTTSYALKYW